MSFDRNRLSPARDPENGYRLFDSRDAERLRFIRLVQRFGYTLQDIRSLIAVVENGSLDEKFLHAILKKRLTVTRRKCRELQHQEHALQQALDLCQNAPPTEYGLQGLMRWMLP